MELDAVYEMENKELESIVNSASKDESTFTKTVRFTKKHIVLPSLLIGSGYLAGLINGDHSQGIATAESVTSLIIGLKTISYFSESLYEKNILRELKQNDPCEYLVEEIAKGIYEPEPRTLKEAIIKDRKKEIWDEIKKSREPLSTLLEGGIIGGLAIWGFSLLGDIANNTFDLIGPNVLYWMNKGVHEIGEFIPGISESLQTVHDHVKNYNQGDMFQAGIYWGLANSAIQIISGKNIRNKL